MNIAALITAIDQQLETLNRIRAIVEGLSDERVHTARAVKAKAPVTSSESSVEAAVPTLTIVPPRQKREYRRRPRVAEEAPTALTASIPSKPVFVAKPVAVPSAPAAATEFNPDAFEASLRQQFSASM